MGEGNTSRPITWGKSIRLGVDGLRRTDAILAAWMGIVEVLALLGFHSGGMVVFHVRFLLILFQFKLCAQF
jgi:hypothetical protein